MYFFPEIKKWKSHFLDFFAAFFLGDFVFFGDAGILTGLLLHLELAPYKLTNTEVGQDVVHNLSTTLSTTLMKRNMKSFFDNTDWDSVLLYGGSTVDSMQSINFG